MGFGSHGAPLPWSPGRMPRRTTSSAPGLKSCCRPPARACCACSRALSSARSPGVWRPWGGGSDDAALRDPALCAAGSGPASAGRWASRTRFSKTSIWLRMGAVLWSACCPISAAARRMSRTTARSSMPGVARMSASMRSFSRPAAEPASLVASARASGDIDIVPTRERSTSCKAYATSC